MLSYTWGRLRRTKWLVSQAIHWCASGRGSVNSGLRWRPRALGTGTSPSPRARPRRSCRARAVVAPIAKQSTPSGSGTGRRVSSPCCPIHSVELRVEGDPSRTVRFATHVRHEEGCMRHRVTSLCLLVVFAAIGCGDGGSSPKATPVPTPTGPLPRAGELDRTFGSDGIVITDFDGRHDVVQALAIQPDGKIVAVGRSDAPVE